VIRFAKPPQGFLNSRDSASVSIADRPSPGLPPGALPTVEAAVERLQPELPMVCLRPHVVERAARRFRETIGCEPFYAVKCNPEESVLDALVRGGVRCFDAASLGEIRSVRRRFPRARIAFLNPVKSRAAIAEAFHQWHVRDFSLDSGAELERILEATGRSDDLGLLVRLRLPKARAAMDLSSKFGIPPEAAVDLLRACRARAARVGLCFHVGSQCTDPEAWSGAIRIAAGVARAAGVRLDILDIGGGFPVSYPNETPPPLDHFASAIADALAREGFAGSETEVWCEPGRALVAAGTSVVLRVLHRRDDELYVNDGVYGTLSDAGVPAFKFPVRRLLRDTDAPLQDYVLWGPTCDSADRMAGPWRLPADMREGDWIEVGQLGAYGICLRTGFNGFDSVERLDVADEPLLTTPGLDEPTAAEPQRWFFGAALGGSGGQAR